MFSSLIVANKCKDEDACKTTLILAPVALLNQWQREIATRIKEEYSLKTLIYHGAGSKKGVDFKDISKYDVVITTYGLLAREYKEHFGYDNKGKGKIKGTFGSLFYAKTSVFHRVVLDEAQYIRNKSTLASKACSVLEAKYRWCLSGTPMQNSVLELFGLLRFLRIEPYDDESRFNRDIGIPIKKRGDSKALQKLQALLKGILLRRTKESKIDGKPILQLPPKEVALVHSNMDEDEKEFYQDLEATAQKHVSKFLKAGTLSKNFSNILVLLLRLRQACCHPKLIERALVLKQAKVFAGRTSKSAVALCRRLTRRVIDGLKHVENLTCPQCMDVIDSSNGVLFYPCGDVICSDCSMEYFETSAMGEETGLAECPTCEIQVKQKEMIAFSVFEMMYIQHMSDSSILAHTRNYGKRHHSRNVEMRNVLEQGRSSSNTDVVTDSDSDFDLFEDEKKVKLNKSTSNSATDLPALIKDESSFPFDPSEIPEGHQKQDGTENKYFTTKLDPLNFTPVPKYLESIFPAGWVSSSKIDKCISIIKDTKRQFPGEKIIVFSLFTSLLDFIEIGLEANDFSGYLRYDGSMSATARNQTVLDFFDKSEYDILLISLKAGNVGLTLTCASHVIIMDPFWNPFVEDQAMDRAHRIGQMRTVFVHRLVIGGTVEDRIMELQKKKKEEISNALDEKGLKSVSRLNQQELLYLFGIGK